MEFRKWRGTTDTTDLCLRQHVTDLLQGSCRETGVMDFRRTCYGNLLPTCYGSDLSLMLQTTATRWDSSVCIETIQKRLAFQVLYHKLLDGTWFTLVQVRSIAIKSVVASNRSKVGPQVLRTVFFQQIFINLHRVFVHLVYYITACVTISIH